MDDRELAAQYLPVFYQDKKEPFPIEAIGFTIFRETACSNSCSRTIRVEKDVMLAIEYAIYFDFDIQHLYDLEHAFVYVRKDGSIQNVEASFHGCFYRSMIPHDLKYQDHTHPILYLQPGKHGIMPAPRYFYLCTDLYEVCNILAGNDGFLVAPMFEGELHTDPETDDMVRTYIRAAYSFDPAMDFIPAPFSRENMVEYSKLEEMIPQRMESWLEKIQAGGFTNG